MRKLCLLIFLLLSLPLAAALPPNVKLRIDTAEADAVLQILDKRAAGAAITDADWARLFGTEGYVRLKQRELSMKREFTDDAFRTFVMSDELLSRRAKLASVVRDWRTVDLGHAAALALAYLPKGATIRATIYPVVKPATNSFVFDTPANPAIFKYVGDESAARFENVIAHELHHIGFSTACPQAELQPPAEQVAAWLGAFSEGFAALAAAGGPDRDAEATSTPEIRAEWARGLANYDEDFETLKRFFRDVAEGKLTGDAIEEKARTFYRGVGPWYSVGWKMGVVIEKTLGRKALVDAMCDRRRLLETYNRAAMRWKGEALPLWPRELIDILR